jgi:hypothetical protein
MKKNQRLFYTILICLITQHIKASEPISEKEFYKQVDLLSKAGYDLQVAEKGNQLVALVSSWCSTNMELKNLQNHTADYNGTFNTNQVKLSQVEFNNKCPIIQAIKKKKCYYNQTYDSPRLYSKLHLQKRPEILQNNIRLAKKQLEEYKNNPTQSYRHIQIDHFSNYTVVYHPPFTGHMSGNCMACLFLSKCTFGNHATIYDPDIDIPNKAICIDYETYATYLSDNEKIDLCRNRLNDIKPDQYFIFFIPTTHKDAFQKIVFMNNLRHYYLPRILLTSPLLLCLLLFHSPTLNYLQTFLQTK